MLQLEYEACGRRYHTLLSIYMLPVRAGSGTDAQLQRDGQLVRETGAPLMRESEAPPAILG